MADSTSDTLTLVAGTNITITTNATSDTVTINSTASGTTDTDTRRIGWKGIPVKKSDAVADHLESDPYFINDGGYAREIQVFPVTNSSAASKHFFPSAKADGSTLQLSVLDSSGNSVSLDTEEVTI